LSTFPFLGGSKTLRVGTGSCCCSAITPSSLVLVFANQGDAVELVVLQNR
jgi:hypothetical protein